MTARADVGQGLRAAAQLIVGIERQAAVLAEDTAGLRHSFWSFAFCLPLAALTHWIDWRTRGFPAPLWHAVMIGGLLYVIGWAGFLLCMRPVLAALRLERSFNRAAVLWNWSNLAQYAVLALVDLTAFLHVPNFALSVAGLVGLFWQIWIEFVALRLALGRKWVAVGLVAMDIAIGLTVQAATFSLHG